MFTERLQGFSELFLADVVGISFELIWRAKRGPEIKVTIIAPRDQSGILLYSRPTKGFSDEVIFYLSAYSVCFIDGTSGYGGTRRKNQYSRGHAPVE